MTCSHAALRNLLTAARTDHSLIRISEDGDRPNFAKPARVLREFS